jgi:hypothetical protein
MFTADGLARLRTDLRAHVAFTPKRPRRPSRA